MKVLINNGSGFVDYTRYVADGSLSCEDSINVPTMINFILTPTDNSFVVPSRSAYVRVVSEVYASGGGGYGDGKVVATGFVTNTPSAEYLGLSPKLTNFGEQQLSYKMNITSDEWLLNTRAVPYIPAFINRTQGEILAGIAETLAPGFFNVTSFVGSGDIVPYYQYSPDKTWSDIAKEFGDSVRYRYKVIDKTIYFQPFGDGPLGIAYDERQPHAQWFPLELQSQVLTVPPVNDALVIGATEPQANWENYFVGDGFSSQFRLLHQVFDGATTLLLQDDWTEDSFQTQLWNVRDLYNLFSLDNAGQPIGALNVLTPSNMSLPLGTDYILGQNGVEMGGGLNLQHGQVQFIDSCSGGIIGGLYEDVSLTLATCIAGFGTTTQAGTGLLSVQQVTTVSGSNVVNMVMGTNPPLQSGNVVVCTSFAPATFLNGQKLSVVSITASGSLYYLQLMGDTYYGTSGTFNVTANIQAIAGDVIVTASGAGGIVFQPIFNGQFVGTPTISLPNHQYVLQTWIGAERWDRYERIYRNVAGTAEFGGNNLAASGTITWVVSDYDEGLYAITPQYAQQTIKPVNTKYTVTSQNLPEFAVYSPINVQHLNLALNYTALYEPPQGVLFVRSLTGAQEYQLSYTQPTNQNPSVLANLPPSGSIGLKLPVKPADLGPEIHYMMGFGMNQQTATVLANQDTNYLAFYDDTIPGVGARIRYQSWGAGQSMSRVVDSVAVSHEAKISGDSGVRSAIFSNLTPQPRTSGECELAAAAAILDREYPQFQGSYTVETVPRRFESLFNPGIYDYPVPGRYLNVYAPYRSIMGVGAASGNYLPLFIHTARLQVTELREEVLQLSVDYGPDLYLEKLLESFTQRSDRLLTPTETAKPPNPIDIAQVGAYFLPTPDSATVVTIQNSAVTGNTIIVDLTNFQQTQGVDSVEIRRVDVGWGNSDSNQLVGTYTSRYVVLSRTARDQTWYLRYKKGLQYSRFSKALRVAYPMIPSSPRILAAGDTQATFDFSGDVRDIYGLELRTTQVTGSSGVLYYTLPNTPIDSIAEYNRFPIGTVSQLQGNVIAVYNPPSEATNFPYATQLQVGDLVITTCSTDKSFSAVQIVSEVITPIPPPATSYITLNSATAYFYPGTQYQGAVSHFYPTSTSSALASKAISSLRFNTMAGVPGDPWVQPMQVDSYDSNGVFHGRSAVWSGATSNYEMYIIGSFFVPAPGNYTFVIQHDDGMLFGIQGASYVSGLQSDDLHHTGTVLQNYTVLGANNHYTNHPNDTYVINFPASGNFNFEFDYSQYKDYQSFTVQANSHDIFPTPAGAGGIGTPWEFGWYDYGKQVPDVVGTVVIGANAEVGSVQLFSRGPFSYLASGGIAGGYTGLCTLGTETPHGFSVGDNVMIGCGWGTWPSNLPSPPNTGAVFCGQKVVTKVNSPSEFQIIAPELQSSLAYGTWEQQIGSSGVAPQVLEGLCAMFPTPAMFSLSGSPLGAILQRPVFSASDLVVDFTQPDIAKILDILEALSPVQRVVGLEALFFNLTWDYSLPTPLPTFDIPSIYNILIDGATQQVKWDVQTGRPLGYRVEVVDPTTGTVYNRFTVDNPNNPQVITQSKLLTQDFQAIRNIVITPFDALGDGIPAVINSPGFQGGYNLAGYEIHTVVNGYVTSGQIITRVDFDQPVAFTTNMVPSQAWIDVPPSSGSGEMIFSLQKFSLNDGTQDTGAEFGCLIFTPGSHVGTFTSNAINFAVGEVMKAIATTQMGNGVGIAVSYSATLIPV